MFLLLVRFFYDSPECLERKSYFHFIMDYDIFVFFFITYLIEYINFGVLVISRVLVNSEHIFTCKLWMIAWNKINEV